MTLRSLPSLQSRESCVQKQDVSRDKEKHGVDRQTNGEGVKEGSKYLPIQGPKSESRSKLRNRSRSLDATNKKKAFVYFRGRGRCE